MKHIVSLSQEKPTYVEYDGASDRFITQGGFGLNDSEADLIEDMAVDLYDDNRWVYFLSPRDFLDERTAFTALNYDILSLGMNLSPGIEYYSFLDSLGFGSPDFLYASIAFREDHSPIHTFMKSVLDIKEFGLKPISDTTPEEWMEHARKSLGHVIRFKDNTFLDLLLATAYVRQICDSIQALTSEQKEDIKRFYSNRNPDVTDMILEYNDNLSEWAQSDNAIQKYEIVDVDSVRAEDLERYIMSRHKGRKVVVDFWNTWCGSCLNSHKIIRKHKKRLSEQGYDFVYIADNSNAAQWEDMVKYIGGEHYLINGKSLKGIWDIYGYPTLFIYDENGNRIVSGNANVYRALGINKE